MCLDRSSAYASPLPSVLLFRADIRTIPVQWDELADVCALVLTAVTADALRAVEVQVGLSDLAFAGLAFHVLKIHLCGAYYKLIG